MNWATWRHALISHRLMVVAQLRQKGGQQGDSSAAEDGQAWRVVAATRSGFPWSMHVSMALVTAAAFLFFEERDSSALIRKLVWSIVIPVRRPAVNFVCLLACPQPHALHMPVAVLYQPSPATLWGLCLVACKEPSGNLLVACLY